MYRCQMCNKVTPAEQSAHLVVTKIRKRSYTIRRRVRGQRRGQFTWQNQPGGDGWECVQELRLCSECAQKAEADPNIPEVVEVATNEAAGPNDYEDTQADFKAIESS